MKRKIFTLMLCALFGAASLYAQRPAMGEIKWTKTGPKVDGVMEESFWDNYDEYPLSLPFLDEVPTLPTASSTTETFFKVAMTYDGIFVVINVVDDDWHPAYEKDASDAWNYDQPEVYFDLQPDDVDAKGSKDGVGHYQCAPTPDKTKIDGTVTKDAKGWEWAIKVDDDGVTWVAEYYVPFTMLTNKAGDPIDINQKIGFDVCVIDRDVVDDVEDAARKRAVWSNDKKRGQPEENYNNMDEAGFMQLTGAPPIVDATSISINEPASARIILNDSTLKLTAVVTPADATYPDGVWSLVNGTGSATISDSGVISPKFDGTVWVYVTTKGKAVFKDSIQILIENQVVVKSDVNLIKNGYFELGADGMQDWTHGAAEVDGDGMFAMELPTRLANPWDRRLGQHVKFKDSETRYHVRFIARVDYDTLCPLVVEDDANGYNKTLTSYLPNTEDAVPYRTGSQWNVPVTDENQVFAFDMIMTNNADNSNYHWNWQLGNRQDNWFYIDSIEIWSDEDLAKVTVPAESITLMAYLPGTTTLSTEIVVGGQLQVSATVLPAGAIKHPIFSVVPGTGTASITPEGILTGETAGTVTVVGTDVLEGEVKGELEINIITGVKDNVANKFSIAPNPVKDVLTITTLDANPKVVIFNTLGSKVYEGTSKVINTRNFVNGVYFIRVNDGAAQKFVK